MEPKVNVSDLSDAELLDRLSEPVDQETRLEDTRQVDLGPPMSDLDRQILNLKASIDTATEMAREAQMTLRALLEAKRADLLNSIDAKGKELNEINRELGIAGETSRPAFNRRKRENMGKGIARSVPGDSSLSGSIAGYIKNNASKLLSTKEITAAMGIGHRTSLNAVLKSYVARGEIRKSGTGQGNIRWTWVGTR